MRGPERDLAAFGDWAATRLRAEPQRACDLQERTNGDHALERDSFGFATPSAPKPAAVLIPVVMHADGPAIILTQRAPNLRDHSGQIALPGGTTDRTDASPLDAALRESEEEIGLERRHVEALGYLDLYLSSSNYLVVPCVGLVSPEARLAINPREVAAAFEVPLAFLMEPRNHELHAREWKGRIRAYYAIPFGRHYIWGVTAGILRNMYERLYGP